MKYYYLISILFLLSMSIAEASDINTFINISITNQSLILKTESGSPSFTIPINGTYETQYVLILERNLSFSSLTQDEVKSLFISELEPRKIDYTEIQRISGNEIDRGVSNQQAWLTQTFMPQRKEIEDCNVQNQILTTKGDLCEQNKERQQEYCQKALNESNQRCNLLARENVVYSFSIGSLAVLLIIVLAFSAYRKYYQKFKY